MQQGSALLLLQQPSQSLQSAEGSPLCTFGPAFGQEDQHVARSCKVDGPRRSCPERVMVRLGSAWALLGAGSSVAACACHQLPAVGAEIQLTPAAPGLLLGQLVSLLCKGCPGVGQ